MATGAAVLGAVVAFFGAYFATYWAVALWPLSAAVLLAALVALAFVARGVWHRRLVRFPVAGFLAGATFGVCYSLLLTVALGGF